MMNYMNNKSALFLLVSVVLLTHTVLAAAGDDKNKDCRKPRLRSITPEQRSEVHPESEFTFTLPSWTDPKMVEVAVKKIKINISVENRNSFFLVKGKIPSTLQGTYARVSVVASAKLGCQLQDGWLYKISEASQTEPEQPDNETDNIEAQQNQ